MVHQPSQENPPDLHVQAQQIYHELHALAHLPDYATCVGYNDLTVTFAHGPIESLEMQFIEHPEEWDYTPLGFSHEHVREGWVEIDVRNRPGWEEERVKNIVVSLTSQGIVVKYHDVAQANEPVTLSQLEFNLLNVFSFLTLIPFSLERTFGTFDAFWKLTGNADMTGINSVRVFEGKSTSPLFVQGLRWYMFDYQRNYARSRDRLDAFRRYIERSGLLQLAAPPKLGLK